MKNRKRKLEDFKEEPENKQAKRKIPTSQNQRSTELKLDEYAYKYKNLALARRDMDKTVK